MISIKKLILPSLVAFMATASIASASIITDDVGVNTYIGGIGDTAEWTHDINDDFTVGSETVVSAGLAIRFRDDRFDSVGPLGALLCLVGGCEFDSGLEFAEYAIIQVANFDLQDGGFFEIDSGVLRNLGVGATGLLSLNSSGLLDVKIIGTGGDFWVRNSRLFADVRAVPAPGALALLGLGLAGIGFARRRKV